MENIDAYEEEAVDEFHRQQQISLKLG